jgi:Tfp pilus assembly protein PilO
MSRFLPLVLLLISIGLFFGYIHPTYTNSIASSKEQIDSYTGALKAAERFTSKEAELTQSRAAIAPESLARLNAFLPDGVDNVQLILDLNALAARSGITLSNFDIKTSLVQAPAVGGTQESQTPLESSNPVDSIDLTMTASGTYNSFRTFLAGIETSLRPLDVISLDIQESKTGVYMYELTVRIYWLH